MSRTICRCRCAFICVTKLDKLQALTAEGTLVDLVLRSLQEGQADRLKLQDARNISRTRGTGCVHRRGGKLERKLAPSP